MREASFGLEFSAAKAPRRLSFSNYNHKHNWWAILE
jgi:hypothetical protein